MRDSNERRQIPLAIVGMACRVPGADGLEPFWQMLVEGRSAVADLPPDRFDRELYYDPKPGVRNKSYTDRGAVVSRDEIDSERTPLPVDLAHNSDITHRIMCQVAADALRHAQLDPYNLPQRNTGVYVGHTVGSDAAGDANDALGIEEWVECLRELESFKTIGSTQQECVIRELIDGVRSQNSPREGRSDDFASHMAAGLISKTFGLSGPFIAVNAACASSLQALVLGGRALQRGEIDMALVGGASVCSRDWLVLFSQSKALSPTDSRPFDHRADGLIVAEAYVALVVKTLEKAIADRSPIQSVISGMGISADGRGRSLWAPRSEGQTAAIRRAYGPGVDIADVQYIEAHATATQLGDATEIASLRQAFEGRLPAGKKIPIASVKANIGHALEAAGLVGVVKTALCMQKGLIPRAINIEALNPKVDWGGAPVYVPLETMAWPEPAAGKPRRAGVNAFGIGGLNVHVVLDAFSGSAAPSPAPRFPVRDPDDEAVAIVGLGCIFPEAHNLAAYWKLLHSVQSQRSQPAAGPGRPVDGFHYDWRRHRIPPKEIELADPLQFMVLDAADQALCDAGYDQAAFDRERAGVIVGTEFAGDFGFRLQVALRLPRTQRLLRERVVAAGIAATQADEIVQAFADTWHAKWPVLQDNTGSFSASSLAVRIAKSWGLMGCAAAVDSGATSGMSALNAAINLLLSRDCDLMICAAAQRNMNAGALTSLDRAGLPGDAATSKPFDRQSSAFVPGEGAGVLLLKRLSDAHRDGDRIHAIVCGIATAHDTAEHALAQSLERAFEIARVDRRELALVMCDACGAPETDERLARAVIASLAGAGRTEPVQLGSVVGQVGHTGGASSFASLIAAVLALRESVVPGVPGFDAPIPTLLRNGDIVQCSSLATPLRHKHRGRGAMSAVLSHGKGLAYCAVIEQVSVSRNLQHVPTRAAALDAPSASRVTQPANAKRVDDVKSPLLVTGTHQYPESGFS